MKLTDKLVDRISNLVFGCTGTALSLATIGSTSSAATAGAATLAGAAAGSATTVATGTATIAGTVLVAAPFAGAMAGAVLIAFAFAARQKHSVESEATLKRIRNRLRKTWRRDPEIGSDGHAAIDEVCRSLPDLLPQCMLKPVALASSAFTDQFPMAATDQVLRALADLPGQHPVFGEPGVAADFTREFLVAAFTAAVEDEDYFRKFEPHLLVQQAQVIGQILEYVEAIGADQEQLKHLLRDLQAKLDNGLSPDTLIKLTRALPNDAGNSPDVLVSTLVLRYEAARELVSEGHKQEDFVRFLQGVEYRLGVSFVDLRNTIERLNEKLKEHAQEFEPDLDLRIRDSGAGGRLFFFAAIDRMPLIGREVELKHLLDWAHDGRMYSWALLTGDGGSGKSRLAFEVSQLLQTEGWQAGFLNRAEMKPELFARFVAEAPTLLVVDYAGLNPAATGEFFLTLRNLAKRNRFRNRVRLLLIDREGVGASWHNELYETLTEASSRKFAASFGPLHLGPLDDDALFKLLQLAAGDAVVPPKEEALKKLRAIDERGRPLFATLAGAAIQSGRHMRDLDRNALLADVLAREEARWRSACNDNKVALAKHKNAVALSTIVRGINLADVPDDVASLSSMPFSGDEFLEALASEMTGQKVTVELQAMEPDIVGEWFVLSHFSRSTFDPAAATTPLYKGDQLVMEAVRNFTRSRPEKWNEVDAFVERAAADFPSEIRSSALLGPPSKATVQDIAQWCRIVGTAGKSLARRGLAADAFALLNNAAEHVASAGSNDPDISSSLKDAVSRTVKAALRLSLKYRFNDRWGDALELWEDARAFASAHPHDDETQAELVRLGRYFASDCMTADPNASVFLFWKSQEHLMNCCVSSQAVDELAKAATMICNRTDSDTIELFKRTALNVRPADVWGEYRLVTLRSLCVGRAVLMLNPEDRDTEAQTLLQRSIETNEILDVEIALSFVYALIDELIDARQYGSAEGWYARAKMRARDYPAHSEPRRLVIASAQKLLLHWIATGQASRAVDEFQDLAQYVELTSDADVGAIRAWREVGVDLVEALFKRGDSERAKVLLGLVDGGLPERWYDRLGEGIANVLFDTRARLNNAGRVTAMFKRWIEPESVFVSIVAKQPSAFPASMVRIVDLVRDYQATFEPAGRREVAREIFRTAETSLSDPECRTLKTLLLGSNMFSEDLIRDD